jgi:hypothetical protein
MAASAELGLPRLFSVEVEYRAALRAAESEFVRSLLGEIADGSLDGLAEWRQFHVEGAVDIEAMFRQRRTGGGPGTTGS